MFLEEFFWSSKTRSLSDCDQKNGGKNMVVQGLIALALAAPTGGLFGLAYGTAIRVGYEIIYPLLFQDIANKQQTIGRNKISTLGSARTTPAQIADILKGLTEMYTTVGGLEANAFGINTGIKNAMQAIQDDPELVELLKKNSSLLGQNITVNLSGTGLIDEQGRVISSTPEFEADVGEEIATKEHQQDARNKAGDEACLKEYGSVYSVAGFDSNDKHVSCLKIVGGHVTSRRPWPPVQQSEGELIKTIPTFGGPIILTEQQEATLKFRISRGLRPAGQTQKSERDRLIFNIDASFRWLKANPRTNTNKLQFNRNMSSFQRQQRELKLLLLSYRNW